MGEPFHPHHAPSLAEVVCRAHQRMAWASIAIAGSLVLLAGVMVLRIYIDSNLQLVARSLAHNVEAAVVFGDTEEIHRTLESMLPGEGIAFARVQDNHGQVLAQWQPHSQGLGVQAANWLGQHILTNPTYSTIHNANHPVGRIEIGGDGQGLLRFLILGMALLLLCIACAGCIGALLSKQMLHAIVTPLNELALAARAGRYERDLALRVQPAHILELRTLGDDFNSLMDELQERHTQLQQTNTALAHEAGHDSLTGLANRAHFERRLLEAMAQVQGTDSTFAVLFLDNDRFKQVNDTHGHEVGDALLTEVAHRIRSQLRSTDLVGRLGGDEFAVLLQPIHNSDDATRMANHILQAMAPELPIRGGNRLQPSVSIGIAVYPTHGHDIPSLLRSADVAMYRAKAGRRGSLRLAEAVNTPEKQEI